MLSFVIVFAVNHQAASLILQSGLQSNVQNSGIDSMKQHSPPDLVSTLKSTLRKLEGDTRPDTSATTKLKQILSQRIAKLEDTQRSLLPARADDRRTEPNIWNGCCELRWPHYEGR